MQHHVNIMWRQFDAHADAEAGHRTWATVGQAWATEPPRRHLGTAASGGLHGPTLDPHISKHVWETQD